MQSNRRWQQKSHPQTTQISQTRDDVIFTSGLIGVSSCDCSSALSAQSVEVALEINIQIQLDYPGPLSAPRNQEVRIVPVDKL